MTDTNAAAAPAPAAETPSKPRRPATKRPDGAATRVKRPEPRNAGQKELAELNAWLADLGYPTLPKVHVNGAQFANCIVTVDFGHPSKHNKVAADHVSDLVGHVRKVARAIMNKEVSIRVSNDNQTGIWWACVG